jgi:hypothetical protein
MEASTLRGVTLSLPVVKSSACNRWKLGAAVHGLADDVDGIRDWVDHRGARHSHFRSDIAKPVANGSSGGSRWHGCFARRSAVRGIQEIRMPQRGAGAGVGVERIPSFRTGVQYMLFPRVVSDLRVYPKAPKSDGLMSAF